MRRREFILALGGAAAGPLVAHAQQAKLPAIGVLVLGSPPPEDFLRGLRDALVDVGYTEGRNILLEIRSAEGNADLLIERPLNSFGSRSTSSSRSRRRPPPQRSRQLARFPL